MVSPWAIIQRPRVSPWAIVRRPYRPHRVH